MVYIDIPGLTIISGSVVSISVTLENGRINSLNFVILSFAHSSYTHIYSGYCLEIKTTNGCPNYNGVAKRGMNTNRAIP